MDGQQVNVKTVLELDGINPQVAARLSRALDGWRKLAEPYRSAARMAIERVAHTATLVGATCGAITNFQLGRHWTFEARHEGAGTQAVRYVLVSGASAGLNALGEYAAHDVLGINYLAARAAVVESDQVAAGQAREGAAHGLERHAQVVADLGTRHAQRDLVGAQAALGQPLLQPAQLDARDLLDLRLVERVR